MAELNSEQRLIAKMAATIFAGRISRPQEATLPDLIKGAVGCAREIYSAAALVDVGARMVITEKTSEVDCWRPECKFCGYTRGCPRGSGCTVCRAFRKSGHEGKCSHSLIVWKLDGSEYYCDDCKEPFHA